MFRGPRIRGKGVDGGSLYIEEMEDLHAIKHITLQKRNFPIRLKN